MTVGKRFSWLASALLPVLVGCQTSAPKQDVDFLRGCWIMRHTDTTSTLRLLPDGPDGETYAGDVLIYSSNAVEHGETFIFSRNGRHATALGPKDASGTPRYKIAGRAVDGYSPVRPGWRVAAFSETWRLGNQEMIRVEGDDENLRIVTAARYGGGPQVVIFEGRRDGCD